MEKWGQTPFSRKPGNKWGQTPFSPISASAQRRAARFGEMARLSRIFVPGIPAHVVMRGHNRQAVFAGDGDRLAFLHYLREAAEKLELAVHSYVLMTNHVHLLVTGSERTSLPRTIQAIGRKYVPRLNRRQDRTGTLWESRYFSALVDTDRYALSCHRYIELNPVRAALVPEPAGFIWSSYLHYAHGKPDDLITRHPTFDALGGSDLERREAYRRLCGEALPPETLARIREATHYGWPIGSEEFCTRLALLTGRRTTPKSRGRPPAQKPDHAPVA
jgi:putative transposase